MSAPQDLTLCLQSRILENARRKPPPGSACMNRMNAIWLTIILVLLASPASAKLSAPKGSHGAQRSIQLISKQLEAFKAAFGRYPTTEEGLQALVKCPPGLPQDKFPRLHFLDASSILQDPWGHPYVYRAPGLRRPSSFDLYSCGRDGVTATDGADADDVNNWDPASPHCWMWEYATPGWQVPCGIGLAAGLLFLPTVWMELRRPKSTANLHGILALLLVLAVGFPPLGLLDVIKGPMLGWLPVVFLTWFPTVSLLMITGSRLGSSASKKCANIAGLLFVLLVFWAILLPAQASS